MRTSACFATLSAHAPFVRRLADLLALGLALLAWRAPAAEPPDQLRAGTNYLASPVHSAEEDQRLLSQFAGLRLADVTDGLDAVGLQHDDLPRCQEVSGRGGKAPAGGNKV